VKAFVIAEEGSALTPEDVVAWCRGRMAAFKIPRYVAFAENFPRSVTKREVERHKLKELSNDGAWDAERQSYGG
jgi:crotonobetaine/carnitine-CoA ligase